MGVRAEPHLGLSLDTLLLLIHLLALLWLHGTDVGVSVSMPSCTETSSTEGSAPRGPRLPLTLDFSPRLHERGMWGGGSPEPSPSDQAVHSGTTSYWFTGQPASADVTFCLLNGC